MSILLYFFCFLLLLFALSRALRLRIIFSNSCSNRLCTSAHHYRLPRKQNKKKSHKNKQAARKNIALVATIPTMLKCIVNIVDCTLYIVYASEHV